MKLRRWIFLPLGFGLMLTVAIVIYSVARQETPRNDAYEFVLVSDDLSDPTYLTHANDERLFVVEKPGRIQILSRDGKKESTPFLDITELVESGGSEQGLLSMVFSPDYTDSGEFYVYYNDSNGDTAVARYRVAADNPNLADPESAEIILQVADPYPNHNGGLMKFGPDGYLYIGIGDGGSANDPQKNGQNLATLLGKLLRIEVVGQETYAIPPDNPFLETEAVRPEIWASGLRNPWRFAFDAVTGDLYIADVGQNLYEEVNFQPASSRGGENYGWNFYEGNHAFENAEAANKDSLTFPVVELEHVVEVEVWNSICSITGGEVYRGQKLPTLQGKYLYGDWCAGTIWTLEQQGDSWQNEKFMDTDFNISSFGVDSDGELYLLSFGSEVWRLEAR